VRDLLSDRDVKVRIEADPTERAREILAGLPFATDVLVEGKFIEAKVPPDRVAEVNQLLVQLGIEVRALVPKRSLEEYFLAITEGISEVTPDDRIGEGDAT
jgi:hypothetical protein